MAPPKIHNGPEVCPESQTKLLDLTHPSTAAGSNSGRSLLMTPSAEFHGIDERNPIPTRECRAVRNVSFNLNKNTMESTFQIRRASDVWFQDKDLRKHHKGYHKDVKRLHKGKTETKTCCYRGLEAEIEPLSKQIGISESKWQVFQHQGSHTPEEIAALYARHCRIHHRQAREMGEFDERAARDAEAEKSPVMPERPQRRMTMTALSPKLQFWKHVPSRRMSLQG